MRIAAIADAHGNLLALDAVLADLRAQAPDLVVNLGDLVSGPFDPAGAAGAQMALGCPTLAGNHERQVLTGGTGASDVFTWPRLSAAHLDWIAGLPGTLRLADGAVFACHGSPAGGDLEYLLEDVVGGRPVLDNADVIRARLDGIGPARLVLCGHTHMPRMAQVDGVLVVNPGSIGMVPHAMECGTPHARYGVLTRGPGGAWSTDLRTVAYDWDGAARQALAHGFPDTARWVASGRA